MEQPTTPLKRADALLNRSRILEAALAIFAERGLDFEIEEIASRAGLGVGTLYRHFTNRDDLLRSILLHVLADTVSQIRDAAAKKSNNPEAALLALIFTSLSVQNQYGPLFLVLRDPRVLRILDQTQLQTVRDQLVEIIFNILQNGIEAKIFRGDFDRELIATTIMGSVMAAEGLALSRWSLEELADKLFQLHLAMLNPTGTGDN